MTASRLAYLYYTTHPLCTCIVSMVHIILLLVHVYSISSFTILCYMKSIINPINAHQLISYIFTISCTIPVFYYCWLLSMGVVIISINL